jgi:hypothetical protein
MIVRFEQVTARGETSRPRVDLNALGELPARAAAPGTADLVGTSRRSSSAAIARSGAPAPIGSTIRAIGARRVTPLGNLIAQAHKGLRRGLRVHIGVCE